jgi:Amidase
LYIGLVIGAQAFETTPVRHAPAVILAMLPNIASWAQSQIDGALAAAGTSASQIGLDKLAGNSVIYHGLQLFGGGGTLAGLMLGAIAAFIIDRKFDRAALLIGKTNLDQFATGLVGTRSPYGVPRNVFDAAYVPGGSSSGSACAVAGGIVRFALGTDTAGSGRVPAAFGNIVGLKPTRGSVSARGVVPACRSLDTISVFASCVDEAVAVQRVIAGYDAEDPYSRVAPFAHLRRATAIATDRHH